MCIVHNIYMPSIRDNIHYSVRAIRGYQKPFNFVMGAREPGKTTSIWLDWIYSDWKRTKRPWYYLTRQIVEISDAFIEAVFVILNKFNDGEPIEPRYVKGSFKEGIVDVFIKDELFIRIVALSISLRRIKLALVANSAGMFMDEYIIDPKTGEKYLKNEAFKIKEAYTTWRRECPTVFQAVFSANVYSLFNPMFVDWGVDSGKLSPGSFYVGSDFVIQWVTISPELRDYLLKNNPLYQFDEGYSFYALEGQAVNDRYIKLSTLPRGYSLRFVFSIGGKYIGIYRNNFVEDMEDRFFCCAIDNPSAKRDVYVIDMEDMMGRTILISNDERVVLSRFKSALRKGKVSFSEVSVYYFIREIFNAI